MSMVTIACDAMGGDEGMRVVVPAAILAIKKHPELSLILVGPQEVLISYVQECGGILSNRLRIHHASEMVSMDEVPTQALKHKKDSSMRVAINLVKSGEAHACVSAGNTGALMATAHFVLKTIPGIERSAISRSLPLDDPSRYVRILDLGANVDCTPEQLEQFAIMGSVLASTVDGVEHPRVALLNIGSEAMKGNDLVKKTSVLMEANKAINYIGFVEADSLMQGKAEVIVCDGFVGNVMLKAVEGIAKYVGRIIKKAFYRNWFTKLLALPAIFVLRGIAKQLDPSLHNGASLVGLRGIVVKSHGKTSVKGFQTAIEKAMLEVEHDVVGLLEKEMANWSTKGIV